jgi:hypothetical protein
MKRDRVEEQKGPLEVGLPTYRTQTREQRIAETVKDNRDRRDGQTLKPHMPKK